MTPAIDAAKKAKVEFNTHQYEHEPGAAYGLEAAEKLQLDPAQVFKTLLVETDKGPNALAVAVIPVAATLDLKATAKALKQKRVAMANPQVAQRLTGYLVGGISPLGQKRGFPTLIDSSAESQATIFVSAGRRGLEIELPPADLARICRAHFAPIAKLK
jgi:Cys-tRNA(Pro)/Cys-tRNA(Cys) deacylase